MTTRELANRLGMRHGSILAHLSRKGHFYGITPTRKFNGRLVWPDNTAERVEALSEKPK